MDVINLQHFTCLPGMQQVAYTCPSEQSSHVILSLKVKSLQQNGDLPSHYMNLNYIPMQPEANISTKTTLLDSWCCFKTHPFHKVTVFVPSPLPRSHTHTQLFYHLINNLLNIFYFLNTLLSLCWLLIYFHLQLKGIPLLSLLIKSCWSAIGFQCSGIKLIPVPTQVSELTTLERIFKNSLQVSKDLILLLKKRHNFFPLVYFLGDNLSREQRQICIQRNNLSIKMLVCNKKWLVKKAVSFLKSPELLTQFLELKKALICFFWLSISREADSKEKSPHTVQSL